MRLTNPLPDPTRWTERPGAGLIGRSAAIRALKDGIDRAARSDVHVLVTGESGVGKAGVARLIHERSARVSASMAALTCADLPDVLLESDLFGHVQGGFTGAYRDKPGLVELAQNGTVLVNDVDHMSARVQVLLRRFLDSGEVYRVGAGRSCLRVNVRVVAGSTRDLRAMIGSRAFCENLYDRLSGICIVIPPLRDRPEDIPPLVRFFLRSYSRRHQVALRLSPDTMAALVAYRWPGNVRELKSVVERTVLVARGAVVGPRDLQLPDESCPEAAVT